MARGPQGGLGLLDALATDTRIAGDYRLHAVRGHLLEMAGDPAAARQSFLAAANAAGGRQQQRYLYARAGRITEANIPSLRMSGLRRRLRRL
jgi:predicted RNA polymerase sigma factor